MTEPTDAGSLGNFISKIGLTDEHTVRECIFELEDSKAPASDLVVLMQRKGLLTPLQGTKLLKGDTDGYFLGGYRILYKISSGTFGRVYRADERGSGQVVAVKVLRNKWTQEKQKVDQFMREGRVGISMRHPNIVSILAVSQDQKTGQYYLVMEFIEGDNLRNILQIRGKLGADESLRMMQECAEGLAYAWSRGLTHRDIKPTNILLSTDKTTKLVDFGLAEISQQTHHGSIAVERMSEKDEDVAVDRTLDYAGLEKATLVTKGDVRSDIYFLGHCLYEMMTGEPLMAVTRDKNVKMMRKRYEDVESTLFARGPEMGLHPAAQRLIAKAVAFEPHMRYQTPVAFLEAIKAARDEIAGNADPDAARHASGALTIYVVESNQKLQDAFRERLKEMGFRVLISSDTGQALRRYQAAPYHAILADAGTVGIEGIEALKRVVKEAQGMRLDLCAVLIVNEDQEAWAREVEDLPGVIPLIRPVGMKYLATCLKEAIPQLQEQSKVSGPG